jgi:hypothetical protein
MGGLLVHIKAVNQPQQLPVFDRFDIFFAGRPLEPLFFKPLVPETKTVPVPIQNLDDISLAVAKTKQLAGKRVQFHVFLNQNGQPIDGFTHIRTADGKIDQRQL